MFPRFLKDSFASFFLLLLVTCFAITAAAQTPSPLSEGQWHKIGITKEGIYKLSYQYLHQNGIISNGANPQNLRIFGQGGGMLPQANSEPRPDGLLENALFISGEEDGKFDAQDYVLFYGQGPDKVKYNTETNQFDYQKNLYSDTVFYFITVGSVKGKRTANSPNLTVSSPVIQEYDGFFAFEEDTRNLLNSGRRWFGEIFKNGETMSYPADRSGKVIPLPYHQSLKKLVPNSTLTISSSFLATDSIPSKFMVSANGFPAQTVNMPKSFHSATNLYAEKGKIVEQTDQLNTNQLGTLEELSLKIEYQGRNDHLNDAYIDYISASGKCLLEYRRQQGPLFFRSSKSLDYNQARFEIAGATVDLLVWDITNPQQASIQAASFATNKLSYGTSTDELKEFVAFRLADAIEPSTIRKVANQNLRTDFSPDFVIIAYPKLLEEAKRLASFRQQTTGLAVKVVSPEQIYNEFSSGAQDVSAIRDYMRYLYQGAGKLRYLLLFGRGYFDYKQIKGEYEDTNLVPVYQSFNSTHPIFSYASDDYYGFLEDGEGSWEETNNVNYSLEIGIGRLPAKNPQEAKVLVDKLIRYENQEVSHGSWRNSVLFIADDQDANVHHRDSDNLAGIVESKWPAANIKKIYLGAFPQVPNGDGESSPAAVDAINKAIDKGALIVNYTGHGRYDVLADEYIITKPIFDAWTNTNKLALFVTATCEFGQHENNKVSGAEHLLLNPKGGAIGLITASRPVYSHTNYTINSAFYDFALPEKANADHRLGDIVRLTKNITVEETRIVNRNFLLLGDPSMKIAYPQHEVDLQSLVFDESGLKADTLGAFSVVTAAGAVLDRSGHPDASFNGIMEAMVFEKPATYETNDHKDAGVMQFKVRNNVIFRGKVDVKEGGFTFKFVVPKNIDYNFGKGKISLYAVDTIRHTDASGFFEGFSIGGSKASAVIDKTPPQISLYLNDSTFVNGEKVGKKSMLLAYLQDKNGINIVSSGVDGGIVATLDGKTSFQLNEYYIAEKGGYTKGQLQYPLERLLPGPHTLTLTARDSYNNISKSQIDFVVSGDNDFQVFNLQNYPNPFKESTQFKAAHSRAGEDIEASLLIYNIAGQLVHQQKQTFAQSYRELQFEEWDGSMNGRKLPPGIYLFKILLRSFTDGSTAEKTEKLVILN